MNTPIDQWIEDNFERQSQSMSGSCQTIVYKAKHQTIPACPDNVAGPSFRSLVIGAVSISLLIVVTLSWLSSGAVA